MILTVAEAMHVLEKKVYGKSLYLPLNFALNLKLFLKLHFLKKGLNSTPKSEYSYIIFLVHKEIFFKKEKVRLWMCLIKKWLIGHRG